MEIEVGKLSGFCPGVQRAVDKTIEEANQNSGVYCFGELVHNKQVIEKIENLGVKVVEDLDEIPDGMTVVFRAHGVKEEIYEKAKNKNLKILDLTCGYVHGIHLKVQREKNDSFIIIVGDANHPEVIGTESFAGENSIVISSTDEILDAYKKMEELGFSKVYVVAQTTFNMKKFEEISSEIEDNFCEFDVIIDNTICKSTELRQNEVAKMAQTKDAMIIIGGKNSANTIKLADISKKYCKNVYHIQTKENLKDIKFSNEMKIGIAAGASTPHEVIEEVENYLNG